MKVRRLRGIRMKLGISAAELAQKLGVTNTTVWKWERGLSSPTKEHVRKLESLLKEKWQNLSQLVDE